LTHPSSILPSMLRADQVFVANPKKPQPIESILRRNKDRLLAFLKDFHNDKDDEQFNVRPVSQVRVLERTAQQGDEAEWSLIPSHFSPFLPTPHRMRNSSLSYKVSNS
jgi:hypothetical protein